MEKLCIPDAEILLLRCHLFPTGVCVVYIFTVYIPLDVNAKIVLLEVSSSLATHPDSVCFSARDFIHTHSILSSPDSVIRSLTKSKVRG